MIFCLSWMDPVTLPRLPRQGQALKMANKATLHKTTFFHSLIKDDYSYLVKGDLQQVEDDLNQVNNSFMKPSRHPNDLSARSRSHHVQDPVQNI